MEIGIIGLPQCGKTTVFNALTGGAAEAAPSFAGHGEPNVAVVKVPDPRLDALAEIFKPKKITQATIQLVDVAGIPREEEGAAPQGLPDHLVRSLATTDALLAVIRSFSGIDGSTADPQGDIDALNLELLISDLQKVENRMERLEKQMKRPASPERDKMEKELAAVKRAHEALEANRPLREVEFTPDEEKLLRGFLFLSLKPIFYLINIDEDSLVEKSETEILAPYADLANGANVRVGALCASIEAEIASLPPDERSEFLSDYSIEEPAFGKIIEGCYDVLGLISFLTAGETEVRAWPIRRGTAAPEAAGAIHGDLQAGFIRAEVVKCADLIECGGYPETRKRGILRAEGKSYIVEDNDVIIFLHSK